MSSVFPEKIVFKLIQTPLYFIKPANSRYFKRRKKRFAAEKENIKAFKSFN
jgi:hypothetical protein